MSTHEKNSREELDPSEVMPDPYLRWIYAGIAYLKE